MENFPPNSKRSEEPRVERVTSAEAVRRKRSLGKQFKGAFIGGSAKTAFEYMITEIVVPAIQDMMVDAFQSGIEKLFRGESRPRRGPASYSNVGHVAYNRMTPQSSSPPGSRTLSRQSRALQRFDEIVIPDRQEANEVIDRLFDLIGRYGSASVANLYELTGIQGSHTDHKWGWTELPGAKPIHLRQGGYLLDLPDPEPL